MSIADQILELEDELEKFRSEEKYLTLESEKLILEDELEDLRLENKELRECFEKMIQAYYNYI